MERQRLVRIAVIVVCLYLIATTIQGTVELSRSGDKVTRREQNLAQLKGEQEDLLRKKAEVESGEFLQRMAYDKLGLTRPKEELWVIPEELLKSGKVATAPGEPNWKLWARLIYNF